MKFFVYRTYVLLTMVGFAWGITTNDGLGAVASFWFQGHLTRINNPSNAIPMQVEEGTPFTGRITWDSSKLNWSVSNSFPQGLTATYYFDSTVGYRLELNIAGHVLTNSAKIGENAGLVSITDGFNNGDSLLFETGTTDMRLDGATFVPENQFSVVDVELVDRSKTAHQDAALPTFVPDMNNYLDRREFRWGVYIDDGNPTRVFSVSGVIDALAAEELFALSIQKLDTNHVQLDWSAQAAGYILETNPVLQDEGWVKVAENIETINGNYQVVVSGQDAQRYFRLRK